MKIGDIVFYNKGNCNLDIGKGVISKIIRLDEQIRLIVNDYKEDGVICNGVLGVTFFLTEEELRNHFGQTERKIRNRDLIHKSSFVYYINNKFPNLLTDDVIEYIFNLPSYDAEIYGELFSDASNMKKCSICGQEQNDNVNYCQNCGAKLNSKPANAYSLNME